MKREKGYRGRDYAGECGCLGGIAVLLAIPLWVFLGPSAKSARWSGGPALLDDLQPGMTVEEARAVFPAHASFEEDDSDCFWEPTWVVSCGADPVRVLRVEPDDPSDELPAEDAFEDRGFGADLYFDDDGELVGVQETAGESGKRGKWKGLWGGFRGD